MSAYQPVECREAFEEFALAHGYGCHKYTDGTYRAIEWQQKWLGFQVAWNLRAARQKRESSQRVELPSDQPCAALMVLIREFGDAPLHFSDSEYLAWMEENEPSTLSILKGIADEIKGLFAPKRESGGEWQPMETAPKDGTTIFVWTGNEEFPGRYEASWREPTDSEHWVSGSDYPDPKEQTFGPEAGWFCDEFYTRKLDGEALPTHWMPMPKPPTTQIEDRKPSTVASGGEIVGGDA